MTVARLAAVAATILSIPMSSAQNGSKYTVWSSVVFSRTGERTPGTLGDLPIQLTSLGAQQAYSAGSFFRERYLTSMGSTNGVGSAPIQSMSVSIPDIKQIYLFGLDQQYTLASAEAFMQGFYPPFQLTSNDTEVQNGLDPINILANGSYVRPPTYSRHQFGIC
jgi:hypothetical protein